MVSKIKTFIKTVFGLSKICGWKVTIKWVWAVITQVDKYIKSHNLMFADDALGEGPFLCKSPHGKVWIGGYLAMRAIRGIWVSNEYLAGGFFSISSNATVVDFGAGLGEFTLLALTYGPNVTVVSVEQSKMRCEDLRNLLEINGLLNRVKIQQAFIGGATEEQKKLLNLEDSATQFITEDEFIKKFDLTHIDFLKCDIEGSEFALFTEDSQLLKITNQLSIELHDWGEILKNLKQC